MPLTMTMKIQPIDSTEAETKSFESVNSNNKNNNNNNKSRFKRFFDFSSFLRGSDKSEPLEFGEPNSVCLDKMVINFIEDNNNNINESGVVSDDDDVNCFGNSVNNDGFCDLLKSLVVCESVVERNLLADVAKMVFDKNKRRDEISRKMVVDGLLGCGYAVAVCKSRWDKTSTYPAGEYEYIDAMIEEERLIIDIDFRSEFEIARSTKSYKAVLQTLPQIFVGKPDRLQKIINIVSDAAKQSLKKKGMPLPPWRRADYVKAKWLSPCTHITNTTANADNSPAENQSFNEKTTKPNPISDPKDPILVNELEEVGAIPEEEKSEEAVKKWEPVEIKPKAPKTGGKVISGLASVIEGK
ncbi:hypothetical protein CTI12_AA219120 [Artemisia annua]|uniref:Uncharacterized protein n=1 Tax=Artemisia annua TaxID=35608 RepID=A0A2U1NWE7_ARTAN|nr:hypothetical protein CTI12_AA219120 [Artemisia annua]